MQYSVSLGAISLQFLRQSVKQSGAAAFTGCVFENKIAAKEVAVVLRKVRLPLPSIDTGVAGQSLIIGVDDLPPENANDCTVRSEVPTATKKRRSIIVMVRQMSLYCMSELMSLSELFLPSEITVFP